MATLDMAGIITRICTKLKDKFAPIAIVSTVNSALQPSSLKTINNTSLVGSGNISIPALPAVTASDNGKVATVVNGAWSAAEGGGSGSAWDFVIKCTNPNGFSSNASDYVWEVGSIDEAVAKYIATKNLTGYVYANSKHYDDEEDFYTYYYETLFLQEVDITGDESLSWYSPCEMTFTGYRTSMGANKCMLSVSNLLLSKPNDDPELPATYTFSKRSATMSSTNS